MNEKPKSIWKKSWSGGRGLFFGWLILMAVLAAIFLIWTVAEGTPLNQSGDELMLFVVAGIGMTVIFLLVISVRWVCCWRNFKRFLFGLACFATLIALFYAEEDWRGWHDWNQFKQQWEAKGEKFDYASIVPPPVPDDQNFAMAPIFDVTEKLANRKWRQAHQNPHPVNDNWWDTNLVDPLQMETSGYSYDHGDQPTNGFWAKATETDLSGWQNYYRQLATKTNEFPIAPQPQSPAQDVLLALSKYDLPIEALRAASQRPDSRFPLDYDDENPAEILLPHLGDLKQCSQVLQLREIAELQNNESQKAMDDVKLSLRLMDSVHTEPILISHLVRIAILQITLQPIYEGLAEHKWSEAQLVALDAELAKLDFLSDYEFSMSGERAMDLKIIEFLQHRNQRKFNELFNWSGDNDHTQIGIAALIYYLQPNGWFEQSKLRISRFFIQHYLPVANVDLQTVTPALIRNANTALQVETEHRTPFNFIEQMLLPALGNAVKKFAYAQSSTDLARVAIALERYRLAHGDYPDSLDALAPQFMEKVPRDVIGGQPLHYRRTDDQPSQSSGSAGGQFVLYSVGWNETDDGGVVVTKPVGMNSNRTPIWDISQGDWVWRYPQK